MRKSAWIIVLFLVGGLYFLSSIPGLRVLPVLSSINSLLANLDFIFVRLSEWVAAQVPLDFGELRHIDTLTQDFWAYARENPIIIEFFLRKLAHVFVFFMITIALFFLLHQYIKSSKISVLLAFLGGGIFAYLDEYRQSFVDGRYGSSVDILIDMVGVTLATCLIIFSLFLTKTGRKRFSLRREEQADDVPTDEPIQNEEPADGIDEVGIKDLHKRIEELEKLQSEEIQKIADGDNASPQEQIEKKEPPK